MKITLELEVTDITNKLILFEDVGELSTADDDVKLQACRDMLGSPIVYSPDGKRRYMVHLSQIYTFLASKIMEGVLVAE